MRWKEMLTGMLEELPERKKDSVTEDFPLHKGFMEEKVEGVAVRLWVAGLGEEVVPFLDSPFHHQMPAGKPLSLLPSLGGC